MRAQSGGKVAIGPIAIKQCPEINACSSALFRINDNPQQGPPRQATHPDIWTEKCAA